MAVSVARARALLTALSSPMTTLSRVLCTHAFSRVPADAGRPGTRFRADSRGEAPAGVRGLVRALRQGLPKRSPRGPVRVRGPPTDRGTFRHGIQWHVAVSDRGAAAVRSGEGIERTTSPLYWRVFHSSANDARSELPPMHDTDARVRTHAVTQFGGPFDEAPQPEFFGIEGHAAILSPRCVACQSPGG